MVKWKRIKNEYTPLLTVPCAQMICYPQGKKTVGATKKEERFVSVTTFLYVF
jgi:hypothetical protein